MVVAALMRRWAVVPVAFGIAMACGSSGSSSPESGDSGLPDGALPDGSSPDTSSEAAADAPITRESFRYVASGIACATSCEPVFCNCPETIATSVADCTADGCIVGGDCEVMCKAPLEQVVGCTDQYDAWLTAWAKHLRSDDGSANESFRATLSDEAGNVIAFGAFDKDAVLDGQSLYANKLGAAFMARFAADGTLESVKLLADGAYNVIAAERAANGDIVTVGSAYSDWDLGGGTFPAAAVIVARFSPNGDHLWSRSVGSATASEVSAVALALGLDDQIAIVGRLEASVDFGGGALPHAGNGDGFVLALTASGDHVWSRAIGSTSNSDHIHDVAIASDGSVWIVGQATPGADFGTGPLAVPDYAAAAAQYSANGTPIWSQAWFGSDQSSAGAQKIAIAGDGRVAIAGFFYGAIDFGGGTLTPTGSSGFVLVLDAAHQHVASMGMMPVEGSAIPDGIAALPDGRWVLLVAINGKEVDVGGVTFRAETLDKSIVTVLDAGLRATRARSFFGSQHIDGFRLSVGPGGRIALGGTFQGGADFGSGTFTTSGNNPDGALIVLDL